MTSVEEFERRVGALKVTERVMVFFTRDRETVYLALSRSEADMRGAGRILGRTKREYGQTENSIGR
ncbi:MAG: hypothetical protein OEV01_16415 [Nitrospira sp.]|nr:hypothetical protein [Nitrospira sp.]MDH4305713.1 hypothetical protein [Nitrospira sp.]